MTRWKILISMMKTLKVKLPILYPLSLSKLIHSISSLSYMLKDDADDEEDMLEHYLAEK